MDKKGNNQKVSLINAYGRSKEKIVRMDWYKQPNTADGQNKELAGGASENQAMGLIAPRALAMVRKEGQAQDQAFSAYMTTTRLAGFCKVALIQSINGYFDMELFDLYFSQRGLSDHNITQTIYQDDIEAFLEQGQYEEITYSQALVLIRDASLQNYKYDNDIEKLEDNKSIHLQRATYRAVKGDEGLFYGGPLGKEEVLNCYLKAVQNKDASLIYELLTLETKAAYKNKDLFVMGWNSTLEDIGFIKSDVSFQEDLAGQSKGTIFILGLDYQKRLIQIELYGIVREEAGGFKIERLITVNTQIVDKEKMLDPMNTQQFVGVFEVLDLEKVQHYFGAQPQIMLSGEFEHGVCYKWLRAYDALNDGINLENHYFVQIILTKRQLLVYSPNLFQVNKALVMLKAHLNKQLFLVLKRLDDIGQLYQSTLLEKGLYPQGSQTLEIQYYCSGEHYQHLLKLCFRITKMRVFHYNDEAIGFYHQVGQDCLEILFQSHYVLINCFSQTIEVVAEVFGGKEFNELCNYILDNGESYRRLPKNVERLPVIGVQGVKVSNLKRMRGSN